MFRRLAVLALLLPLSARALDVPPWSVVDNRACYSFDDAKRLKLAIKTCELWEAEVPIRRQQVIDLGVALDKEKEARLVTKEASGILAASLVRVQKERDEAILAHARSEKYSIFGGGLPWVIVTAAISAAGGAYLGWRLSR